MNLLRFCFFVPMLAPAVKAGTSVHYTLAPEALDSGGLRSASAHYTLDASAMPGGAGGSASYTARTGHAGQLSEPSIAVPTAVGIALSASPSTINEGGTRQLLANLRYNDGTMTSLPSSSVTWSVQSGSLSGITAAGLASASAVYQNSTAVVRGTYQTFTATVDLPILNTLPDNLGPYASDGIPDEWQVQYFGLDNPKAAPSVDADGDGWDNLFEYNARLTPTDAQSSFLFSISQLASGAHELTFSPRLSGCIYSLQGSSDLRTWSSVSGTTTDTGILRKISDPTMSTQRRFYALDVQRQ